MTPTLFNRVFVTRGAVFLFATLGIACGGVSVFNPFTFRNEANVEIGAGVAYFELEFMSPGRRPVAFAVNGVRYNGVWGNAPTDDVPGRVFFSGQSIDGNAIRCEAVVSDVSQRLVGSCSDNAGQRYRLD